MHIVPFPLQVLVEEKLAENAARLGPIFRQELQNIGSPLIQTVRQAWMHHAVHALRYVRAACAVHAADLITW